MKVNAITLRSGNVLDHDGQLWSVVKNDIIQPGKGNSVCQVEIRNLDTGSKSNVRFRTQETVERVRLEQDEYQFLYEDDNGCNFMHQETFEQITIDKELIGYPGHFLQEGMVVEVESHEGKSLGVQMPDTVTVLIKEAEPVVKGQTATTSFKPAILENGVKVMVPPHIASGTRIVVKTEDGAYVERAKD